MRPSRSTFAATRATRAEVTLEALLFRVYSPPCLRSNYTICPL
nr:MAG TPA: Protein of unknown function (DUF1684) [Caudoviricetes sp.]